MDEWEVDSELQWWYNTLSPLLRDATWYAIGVGYGLLLYHVISVLA